jgi:hypothetical protein
LRQGLGGIRLLRLICRALLLLPLLRLLLFLCRLQAAFRSVLRLRVCSP